MAVAAGHEHAVSHGGSLAARILRSNLAVSVARQRLDRLGPAAVDVTCREAQQQVRRAVIRRNLIRVQLADAAQRVFLADRILHVSRFALAPTRIDVGRIAEILRLGPFKKILRSACADVATFAKVAVVFAILVSLGIPERDILRVERAFRDHRLGVHQRPMNRVRRLESVQPMLLAANSERLVLRVGRALGVRVAEGHEGMCPDAVPDDVVLLRAVPVKQLQLRLRPTHAVRAFGITIDVARVRPVLAAKIGIVAAAVVHAVFVAVLEHRDVVGRVPFPRLVGLQRDLARRRRMQPQIGAARESFDERVVHEQLAPRADTHRLRGQRHCVDTQQGDQNQRARHEILHRPSGNEQSF